MTSKIEWTDETWNPIVGCSKISEGCRNCYAERMAFRLANMCLPGYTDVVGVNGAGNFSRGWTGKTAFVESALDKPLRWKKPRRIFVCSMGDLFHESVPDKWINQVFATMALFQRHTFIILTKRPNRMKEYMVDISDVQPGSQLDFELYDDWRVGTGSHDHEQPSFPLPNLWLGVTAENQQAADQRIPILLQIPAAVRFVSVEPMLGPLELFYEDPEGGGLRGVGVIRSGGVTDSTPHSLPEGYDDSFPGLDWVICGGESGPGARPIHPDWVRSLRDQCQAAEVPFFFKQWGEWAPVDACAGLDAPKRPWHDFDEDVSVWRIGKKKAGRLLDGEIWDQYPVLDNSQQEISTATDAGL